MAITGGLGSEDSHALKQTADSTQQLVKLNQETSRQTKWLIFLTIIMIIPIIRDIVYWLVNFLTK